MLVRSALGTAPRQTDMPLEHTLFEQVFAVCCNNPSFSQSIVDTCTPLAHSSCSRDEPFCTPVSQCDLGLLELLLRVPNTTVREHTSLVLQSLFMATPSQLLPALIQQQCLHCRESTTTYSSPHSVNISPSKYLRRMIRERRRLAMPTVARTETTTAQL